MLTASDWLPPSAGVSGWAKGNTQGGADVGVPVPAVGAGVYRGSSTMLSCGSSRVGLRAPWGQSATVRPACPCFIPLSESAGKIAVVASARVPRS
ncbi:hypothetical protein BJQ89_00576 [Arthrobacter sp. ES1]|nr:hypothetical protein [Arthrobacter sp. ES1]